MISNNIHKENGKYLNAEDAESGWRLVVDEIQQRYMMLGELIELLEPSDGPNQHLIQVLTQLQQQLQTTLTALLAEASNHPESGTQLRTFERLDQIRSHTQILQHLKEEVDQNLVEIKQKHALL